MGCGAISGTQDVLKPQLQFRKVKSIIKSQSSQIWTCQNKNNQKFSIKVFKKIYINDENQTMLKNFQHQINRLYRLTEKNTNKENQSDIGKHLMPYFRAWKDQNGNLSLIMKYIQQSSLGDEVKGKLPGVFNEQQISKFTLQILKTIKYLRKNTSIFCNIKPTNIFLDKKRQNIILTDYYNLEEYFNLTQTNIFNNPIYSAPQNVLFNQYFQQTDIWRVGCFIVQMLTCIKPWFKETSNNQKIIQNLKNMQRPPLPQKISFVCKNFLQKCFQTDHNRRLSLSELLNHEFLTQNFSNTQKLPSKVDKQNKYQRQNTEAQQIASYNFQVQIIQQTPRREKHSKRVQTERTNLEQLSSKQNTLNFRVPRKKATSNYLSAKTYETSKVIISKNDENYQQSMIEMKKSKNFRSKRIKTQTNQRNYVSSSPYMKKNSQKEILSLFNKKKNSKIVDHSFQMPNNANDLSVSRKISRTSDYRLGDGKNKIPTNKITLNNQVISFNENSSTRYWPAPEIPAPFDSLDTAQRLTKVMKQIQTSGGPKYYKKPLKLLKQKMRDKTSLRTETSLTFEDSRALLERSQQDIEQIDFQESNNMISQDYPNQSQVSKISLYPTYENRVIETMVSKAYKDRLQTQQKILKQQRQKDKVKWQKQLQEGRQFIKNEINKRYYPINKRIQKISHNSQHF